MNPCGLYVVLVLAVVAETVVSKDVQLKNEAVLRSHVVEKRSIPNLLQLLQLDRWLQPTEAAEPNVTAVSVTPSVEVVEVDPSEAVETASVKKRSAERSHHHSKRSLDQLAEVDRLLHAPQRKIEQYLSKLPGGNLLVHPPAEARPVPVINLNSILKSVGLQPLDSKHPLYAKHKQPVTLIKPVYAVKGQLLKPIRASPVIYAPFQQIPVLTLVEVKEDEATTTPKPSYKTTPHPKKHSKHSKKTLKYVAVKTSTTAPPSSTPKPKTTTGAPPKTTGPASSTTPAPTSTTAKSETPAAISTTVKSTTPAPTSTTAKSTTPPPTSTTAKSTTPAPTTTTAKPTTPPPTAPATTTTAAAAEASSEATTAAPSSSTAEAEG